MILVSIAFAVVEPISAFMLASIVVRTQPIHPIPWVLRVILAALAAGLLAHAAGSVEVALDYRPPRTWAWLGVNIPINAAIWFAWFWSHARLAAWENNHAERGKHAKGELQNDR